MRVLQITAFNGFGCTGRIATGLHNVLTEYGIESVIAWGRVNTAPEEVPTIRIGNRMDQYCHGLYTRLTDKCGFGSRTVTREFLKKLDEYEPDLLQLHILHGYYINLELLFRHIKKKQIPVVWTFHDCWAFTGHCPYFDLAGCEKWKTGCNHCPMRARHPASWFMDHSEYNWKKKKELFTEVPSLTVVTPSEWLAGLVKESFLGECRIEVIPNGIDLKTFKPTENHVRERLGLRNQKIVLGVSSTWVKSKGIDDLIQLSRKLPDSYQVVLVGLTKKQAADLPETVIGVQRTDSTKELAELYSAADVFVNPTYKDNYPTTNLEALACGTPVVTYDSGGSVEAVKASGYGAIVGKGDIGALCRAVVQWANVELPKRCLYPCDEKENFKKYVQLYEEIMGEVLR